VKEIVRGPEGSFLYYWKARKVGFVGIRISLTHAWVIVGVAKRPEQLLVIGPGPSLPVRAEEETEEFREVRGEVAACHPELEQVLSGAVSIEEVAGPNAVSATTEPVSENGFLPRRTISRTRSW
jgi:hypothetical protein